MYDAASTDNALNITELRYQKSSNQCTPQLGFSRLLIPAVLTHLEFGDRDTFLGVAS